MGEFDRTQGSYIEEKIRSEQVFPRVAIVKFVYEHTKSDDDSNIEVDVLPRDRSNPIQGVPVGQPGRDVIHVPEPGDMVLLEYIDGNDSKPIVTKTLYNDQDRAPLGKSGDIRYKRGNLYFEMDRNLNWIEMAHKDNDDDSPDNANVRITINDPDNGDPNIEIDVNNNTAVKLGDTENAVPLLSEDATIEYEQRVDTGDGSGGTQTKTATISSSGTDHVDGK